MFAASMIELTWMLPIASTLKITMTSVFTNEMNKTKTNLYTGLNTSTLD